MRTIGVGFVIAAALVAACKEPPDIHDPLLIGTNNGTVRGLEQNGTRAWLGIPYAAPPVGVMRFRPPARPQRWSEPRDTVAVGPQCPQTFGLAAGGGSEDCLYLNVWSPPDAVAGTLPVMVWFHGGAFVFGSGGDPYYRGEALAANH